MKEITNNEPTFEILNTMTGEYEPLNLSSLAKVGTTTQEAVTDLEQYKLNIYDNIFEEYECEIKSNKLDAFMKEYTKKVVEHHEMKVIEILYMITGFKIAGSREFYESEASNNNLRDFEHYKGSVKLTNGKGFVLIKELEDATQLEFIRLKVNERENFKRDFEIFKEILKNNHVYTEGEGV